MAQHGKHEIVLNSNRLSPYVSAQTRKNRPWICRSWGEWTKTADRKNQLIWNPNFGTSHCNMTCFFKENLYISELAPMNRILLTAWKIVTCRRLVSPFVTSTTGVSGRFRVAERTHLWKVPSRFLQRCFFSWESKGMPSPPPLEIRP